jgi:hypothetical protein
MFGPSPVGDTRRTRFFRSEGIVRHRIAASLRQNHPGIVQVRFRIDRKSASVNLLSSQGS